MSEISQTMPMRVIAEEDLGKPELPPEQPSLPPGEWLRKNLFSSAGNTILTIVVGLLLFWAFRGLLNFAFNNAERDWTSIATNMRLFLTFAYPVDQFVRVWVSLGILLSLGGFAFALTRNIGGISLRRIATWFFTSGLLVAAATLLVKGPLERDGEGVLVFNEENEAIRNAVNWGDRAIWFIVAAVLFGIAAAIWFGVGDRRRFIFIPTHFVLFAGFGALVLSLFVVKYGHYGLREVDGALVGVAEPDSLVARSTRIPWLVMWIVTGVAYFVGTLLRSRGWFKGFTGFAWLLAPPFIMWVILRDPEFDWAHVWSTDIPMFLAFALGGGAILWLLSKPDLGEIGRLAAFGLAIVAVLSFLSGAFGWFSMLQKARISFVLLAMFAIVAHNFAGDKATRLRFVGAWVATIAVVQYFITAINTPSTLQGIQSDTFLGGFLFTLFAAFVGLVVSFPLGAILALARTSKFPIFRILATTFIEVVRGIPFITVLFFFSIMLPLFLPEGMEIGEIAGVLVGLVLFSAAYMAENIRGGLQSIRRGQFEAADAIGLTPSQRTGLIVMPQALRVSIPPLVGQAIATYKETSLFAIIGIFDFLRIANNVIPNQSTPVNFVGHKREGLLFVSLIYFIGSFAMSKYSQKLEKDLGVGTR